jgi:hypothetical protein
VAISVTQAPFTISRVGGEHIYICTSTNLSESGFKFIVEIVIDSVTVYKGYHDPNPQGRLVFNARKVLEAYVKTDARSHTGATIHRPSGWFARNTNGAAEYTIEFGELYVDSGSLTEFTDLANRTRTVLQGAMDGREEYNTAGAIGYNLNPYINDTATAEERYPFLTGRIWSFVRANTASAVGQVLNIVNPIVSPFQDGATAFKIPTIPVRDTDDGVLSFWNAPQGTYTQSGVVADEVEIKFYNGQTLLNTYDIGITAVNGTRPPSATEVDGRLAHMGLYPNNPLMLTLISSNSNYTRYTAQLKVDSSGDYASQLVQFQRISAPCKNTARRVAWANRFGGYDYFWFEGATQFSVEADRKTFRRLRGDYGGTSLSISKYDAERENFYNDTERLYRLIAGGVSNEERVLLEQMFTSKLVWMHEDGAWMPVTIEANRMDRMGKMSRYFTVEINLKLSYDVNA